MTFYAAYFRQKSPFTGSIDEGADIQKIKECGVEHLNLYYNLSPEATDMNRIIEVSKELLKFAT